MVNVNSGGKKGIQINRKVKGFFSSSKCNLVEAARQSDRARELQQAEKDLRENLLLHDKSTDIR